METEPTLTETPVCVGTVPISASANTPPMSHPSSDDDVANAEEDPEAGDENTDKVAHLEDGLDEENMSISSRSVRSSRLKSHVLV
jgi:hypothetical protein